jgi:hypothetical protein
MGKIPNNRIFSRKTLSRAQWLKNLQRRLAHQRTSAGKAAIMFLIHIAHSDLLDSMQQEGL